MRYSTLLLILLGGPANFSDPEKAYEKKIVLADAKDLKITLPECSFTYSFGERIYEKYASEFLYAIGSLETPKSCPDPYNGAKVIEDDDLFADDISGTNSEVNCNLKNGFSVIYQSDSNSFANPLKYKPSTGQWFWNVITLQALVDIPTNVQDVYCKAIEKDQNKFLSSIQEVMTLFDIEQLRNSWTVPSDWKEKEVKFFFKKQRSLAVLFDKGILLTCEWGGILATFSSPNDVIRTLGGLAKGTDIFSPILFDGKVLLGSVTCQCQTEANGKEGGPLIYRSGDPNSSDLFNAEKCCERVSSRANEVESALRLISIREEGKILQPGKSPQIEVESIERKQPGKVSVSWNGAQLSIKLEKCRFGYIISTPVSQGELSEEEREYFKGFECLHVPSSLSGETPDKNHKAFLTRPGGISSRVLKAFSDVSSQENGVWTVLMCTFANLGVLQYDFLSTKRPRSSYLEKKKYSVVLSLFGGSAEDKQLCRELASHLLEIRLVVAMLNDTERRKLFGIPKNWTFLASKLRFKAGSVAVYDEGVVSIRVVGERFYALNPSTQKEEQTIIYKVDQALLIEISEKISAEIAQNFLQTYVSDGIVINDSVSGAIKRDFKKAKMDRIAPLWIYADCTEMSKKNPFAKFISRSLDFVPYTMVGGKTIQLNVSRIEISKERETEKLHMIQICNAFKARASHIRERLFSSSSVDHSILPMKKKKKKLTFGNIQEQRTLPQRDSLSSNSVSFLKAADGRAQVTIAIFQKPAEKKNEKSLLNVIPVSPRIIASFSNILERNEGQNAVCISKRMSREEFSL